MKTFFLLSLMTLSVHAFAGNQCSAFINYEGTGPEPTKIDCSAKTKDAKECKKSCTKVALKKCPKGTKSFTGTFNFNSDKTGFEADSVEGKCK